MWKKAEQTFSGSDLNDNWNALFAMADLVAETGNKLSEKLGYPYPLQLETDIRNYLNTLRANEQ
jgi:aminoglycoside 6-adenylyltransferase